MSIATLGRFEVVLAADLGFCFEAAGDESPLLESSLLASLTPLGIQPQPFLHHLYRLLPT
jgi:hypothetical protein